MMSTKPVCIKEGAKHICLAVMFLLVFGGITCSPSYSQEVKFSEILDQKSITLILSNISVKNALHALSSRSNVPIGFIGIDGEDGIAKKINIKVVQGNIREVLNEIVKADDRYKWEIVNGVINVSPLSLRNNIPELKIENLNLSEIEVSKVGAAILDAPEIQATLDTMGKKKTEQFNYVGPPSKNEKISVVLLNKTIRESLNQLLYKRQASFWAIETFGKKDEFVRIILFD